MRHQRLNSQRSSSQQPGSLSHLTEHCSCQAAAGVGPGRSSVGTAAARSLCMVQSIPHHGSPVSNDAGRGPVADARGKGCSGPSASAPPRLSHSLCQTYFTRPLRALGIERHEREPWTPVCPFTAWPSLLPPPFRTSSERCSSQAISWWASSCNTRSSQQLQSSSAAYSTYRHPWHLGELARGNSRGSSF